MTSESTSTDIRATVLQYRRVLQTKSARLFRQYQSREKADPESTRAEAALYSLMRALTTRVDVNEDPQKGGPDFICSVGKDDFLVEVSSLSVSAVEKASGISNAIESGSGWFSPIGRQLCEKAIQKVGQLRQTQIPNLLAITTEHNFGSILMDQRAARRLLTGNDYITFFIGDPDRKISVETAFQDSVFYSLGYDQPVDHYRRDISAIILVHITSSALRSVGVLNPAPSYEFKPSWLPQIPFFRATINHAKPRPTIVIESTNKASARYVYFSSLTVTDG